MIANTIQALQSRILSPSEVVDYPSIVQEAYPNPDTYREAFYSLKIQIHDNIMNPNNAAARLNWLDQRLPTILGGKGCIMREGHVAGRDVGFLWLISLPVPKSEFPAQLNKVMNILDVLTKMFNIVPTGLVETNVSGRCTLYDVESCMNTLMIPDEFKKKIFRKDTSFGSNIGDFCRINDTYTIFRVRWGFDITDRKFSENITSALVFTSAIFK